MSMKTPFIEASVCAILAFLSKTLQASCTLDILVEPFLNSFMARTDCRNDATNCKMQLAVPEPPA
jgi:hypothetical protein